MKYCNAVDILPKQLLDEIRKYMTDGFIYVPLATPKKSWGSLSGQREELEARNKHIYEQYITGKPVNELATEQFLSTSTIYRIIRSYDS